MQIEEITQGQKTEWWTIFADDEIAGKAQLTFEFFHDGDRKPSDISLMALFSTHSSNNSMELGFTGKIDKIDRYKADVGATRIA